MLSLSKLSEAEYRDSALYHWIHNIVSAVSPSNNAIDDSILEVLPLNSEQETSVQTALTSNLTIVTGPPGTGKSQVVTNILVNAAWKGKNVLFSSRNHKAVDVVEERVNGLHRKPTLLRIGGTANKLSEFVAGLLESQPDPSDRDDLNYFYKIYNETLIKRQKLLQQKNVIMALRNQVDKAEQKASIAMELLGEHYPKIGDETISHLNDTIRTVELTYAGAQKKNMPFFKRLFWFTMKKKRLEMLEASSIELNKVFKPYTVPEVSIDLMDPTFQKVMQSIKDCVRSLQFLNDYKTVQKKLMQSKSLEQIDTELMIIKKSLSEIAEKLWGKWLVTRPLNLTPDLRLEMSRFVSGMKLATGGVINDNPELVQLYRKIQKEMMKFLPCWAITSLSVSSQIPFISGQFDLLIIDEASQCDIASILPLLYRAKKAVIIGDPKQLSHISSISKQQDFNLIRKYSVGFEWSYNAQSLYGLANSLSKADSIISLRDHHRSFLDIIEFSNQEFYEGKLRVATNYQRLKIPQNSQPGIRWTNVAGNTIRPKEGGAFNNAEISSVVQELKSLSLQNKYTGSIGVVTPFRHQARKIAEAVAQDIELASNLAENNEFLVDTVHKFQGDEKDVIIFSAVISSNTPESAIGFLCSTGNLFNVAVTRARSMLIVVGDMNYCSTCKVPYMERFVKYISKLEKPFDEKPLQAVQAKSREYPKTVNMEQVSEWEKILYSALYDVGINTTPQFPADKYRLDLALFQNERKLDIEVDGEMYHRDWNGELLYRDQLRNQRLIEMGWSIRRFWVYQVRDELDWCIEQIKQWMVSA